MAVHPKTILVVDDDELVVSLLEPDLRRSGFAVLTAGNGKEALDLVSSKPVDIIVSDIAMPEMDGFEFCERIRQSPDHVDIPFIFLSAHGGADERMQGLRSGADEYLVKPVNTQDLMTRIEILYDRIQRKRSVGTLKGSLRDVSLCEILQLFELTRKQGVLHLDAFTGKGTLAVADGALLNAVWNDLEGEDAAFQMFTLTQGSFRFQPTEVPAGNMAQPIGVVLMEMARLTDELATVQGHIPAPATPLIPRRPFDGDDDDLRLVNRAITEGCATLSAAQHALRMSEVRLRLAIGKLVEGGFVTPGETPSPREAEAPSEPVRGKPAKLLIAFTDEAALSRCVSLMGNVEGRPMQRSGLSDFSRVTVSSRVYDVVCLRGEKRFAFMWELVLKTSEGAVFLLTTDGDKEHAAFFSARAACLQKPVVRMCLGASLRNATGVQTVTTPEEMLQALSALQPGAR